MATVSLKWTIRYLDLIFTIPYHGITIHYYASSYSLKPCFLKVGQILDTLDRLNLSEKTLVYFTSDHGAHIDLGRKGGSNGLFIGGKGMGAIEGGIRVPAMIRWPSKNIEGNLKEINTATTLMDFLPTIKEAKDFLSMDEIERDLINQ